ncbi:hypothetical protein COP2_032297 [Malus domestica]
MELAGVKSGVASCQGAGPLTLRTGSERPGWAWAIEAVGIPHPTARPKPGPSQSSCTGCLSTRFFLRMWALDSHGDDLFAVEEDEAQCPAIIALFVGLLSFQWRQLVKLLVVAEDEIHMVIEGYELTD